MFNFYLRFQKLVEVWGDIEEDAIYRSRESDSTEKQNKEHEVRIRGGEIHHLMRTGDK